MPPSLLRLRVVADDGLTCSPNDGRGDGDLGLPGYSHPRARTLSGPCNWSVIESLVEDPIPLGHTVIWQLYHAQCIRAIPSSEHSSIDAVKLPSVIVVEPINSSSD